jgi:hypothetical protein
MTTTVLSQQEQQMEGRNKRCSRSKTQKRICTRTRVPVRDTAAFTVNRLDTVTMNYECEASRCHVSLEYKK